ncbi:hypothetical protein [Chromobacterium paludis]|uniref:Uncharacterized protein n=1 Tax=Chromobacterium paludis TaxID=2605945 RepID=A0A5C1DJW7_9NEIS|nr:hypothetical protein [Chromobacterium paludis]QEL56038.1 hypothetical protein FYK34_10960 [Chromobacterium paludis]
MNDPKAQATSQTPTNKPAQATPGQAPAEAAKPAADAKVNKMEVATEIYKQMIRVKDVTRQDIIEQFVAKAGLTKAGAATYYQIIKCRLTR